MNRYVKMATGEGHSEQEYVAERLVRYDAGTRMHFSETTPESLGAQILKYIGMKVSYRKIPTDGAQRAAQIMNRFLL